MRLRQKIAIVTGAAAFVRAGADNCGGFDIVVNNANFITGILLPVDGGRTA